MELFRRTQTKLLLVFLRCVCVVGVFFFFLSLIKVTLTGTKAVPILSSLLHLS